MKIMHLAGHNYKWNLDSYFENDIGDGFVFTSYSLPYGSFGGKLSGYKPELYTGISAIDTQFFGNRDSYGGKLSTYPFHPINSEKESQTVIGGISRIKESVIYQQEQDLKIIIIPNIMYDSSRRISKITNKIHNLVMPLRNKDELFFMTLCFGYDLLMDKSKIEYILQNATDMGIHFDGYYLVFESRPGYKQKIMTNVTYYENVLNILRTLKKQKFKTFVSYANFNILVFLALCDIDFVTIGTYENLRNFSIERFTEDSSGGPSKGWFFSEKLLNFIKAEYIDFFRSSSATYKIANDKNIFSDAILHNDFVWDTTHRPPIHKNYLLAISRLIAEMDTHTNIKKRAKIFLDKIDSARNLYEELVTEDKIFLGDESADYYLAMWKSFIQRHSA